METFFFLYWIINLEPLFKLSLIIFDILLLCRMQLWLNDPNNIEKLLNVKSDMREATKRRHGLDSSSDRSSPLDTLGIKAENKKFHCYYRVYNRVI